MHGVILMTTGQRIKEARKRVGMTQNELAIKLGVPFQSVSQWERNTRKPKIDTLQKIASALGVNLVELSEDLFDQKLLSLIKQDYSTDEEFQAAVLNNEISIATLTNPNDVFLLRNFFMLNEDGQELAIERVVELTMHEEYLKDRYTLSPSELKERQNSQRTTTDAWPPPPTESSPSDPETGKK